MRIKTKHILLLMLLGSSVFAIAAPMSVRLFSTNAVQTFIFSPSEGSYTLYGDGTLIQSCDASDIFQFSIQDTVIFLKTLNNDIGVYSSFKIVANNGPAGFKIKSVIPTSKVRSYEGDLMIGLVIDTIKKVKELKVINHVGLESYVAGVVESESGRWNNEEYYKLQAILCRTYALTNTDRHIKEGYQVCDDVHCQVYLHKTTHETVRNAVSATNGLVVVDSDMNLITAVFHSNCGGETCNSEDVWASSTSYLKAIKDPYCQKKANAEWDKTISLDEWNSYLKKKEKEMLFASIIPAQATNQNYKRVMYYSDKNVNIPMKQIRSDFQLKSAFFTITKLENSVVFKGRGYGHGVGLCQEGAMTMSKLQYSYLDILNHYYQNVNVIKLDALNYFRLE